MRSPPCQPNSSRAGTAVDRDFITGPNRLLNRYVGEQTRTKGIGIQESKECWWEIYPLILSFSPGEKGLGGVRGCFPSSHGTKSMTFGPSAVRRTF